MVRPFRSALTGSRNRVMSAPRNEPGTVNGNTSMPSATLEIVEADLKRPDHQRMVVDLIDAYAMDPMGNGGPLPPRVKRDLIPGLHGHPTTLIWLALRSGEAAGIAVCFVGFSTFAARPLINIHDLAVRPRWRGGGIGRRLLEAVEEKARGMGCCKVTLEVLANNHRAMRIYAAAGFAQAVYGGEGGAALFYAKHL